jgi:hypothetical protein
MRRLFALIALAAAMLLNPFGARAATTTNFTDQWWVPGESGWGVAVHQQGDVLFLDLFVYGADGRPAWFTAAARHQPTPVVPATFAGDLYQSSGPAFKGTFDPAAVTNLRVGSLTFAADSTDTATLRYSVDGVEVVKDVTRQLWTYENFSGRYSGGVVYDLSQCMNKSDDGHVEDLGEVRITQGADNAFAMTTEAGTATCSWNGTYSQLGHMGSVRGTFLCVSGLKGTFTAFEMEKTVSGMSGRLVANDPFCRLEGRFGGLLR